MKIRTELDEVFSDEPGMVEAAGADMFTDGGEGNDSDWRVVFWEDMMYGVSERNGGRTDGFELEVTNENV